MMSHKDYQAFAAMLASHGAADTGGVEDEDYNTGYEAARLDIGRSLAAILRLDNPRFDAARFFDAAKL